ncbi:AAA family ATPase [Chishuiella sp.]|uniref:AAA family ATPase n=1 Tax=Chishuiella sp. TaxID=1969467 RepID=UPI0028A9163E|nr:AAA family ATPase [Chishuiella sp.]
MFKINRLRTEILTNKSKIIDQLYGFDYNFNQGLNIIAGENSRGKTTINSCIFYALGMEELLGGHNNKALDKALKDSFIIKTENTEAENEITYQIIWSKVYLEIENSDGDSYSLERVIKSANNEEKESNITIYKSTLKEISKTKEEDKDVFFVNGPGNNDNPNGFYQWLTDFIGITIPDVSNSSSKSNYSPLYLQLVFSSLFIEQTKGWSDFFATMPYFGVTKPKEKVIEFLLGLDEMSNSTKRDIYNRSKNEIIENWNKSIKAFSFLGKQNNATIDSLPENITTDKNKIEKISSSFHIAVDEKITYDEHINAISDNITILENKPFSTIASNKNDILLQYEADKSKYIELKEYITNFESRLSIEKTQQQNIDNQLTIIEKEIKEHNSLIKVFNNNLFRKNNEAKCPTCTQTVTQDILSSDDFKIPQYSLEENKSFLVSQKKIIKTSLDSLNKTIEEKNTLLQYFKNTLRNQETIVKSLSKDLIADDRTLSESEIVKKIQLQQEYKNLEIFKFQLEELKNSLVDLANKYHNVIKSIEGLEESDDNNILNSFETNYKDLLFKFGYDSNRNFQISINRKDPFKYFPVYKRGKDDPQPQSIRINSSASDFVRNIWAYTLALRDNGVNHPGLIMFDEPGQHKAKQSSLKALLQKCSETTEKQTIIFSSAEKELDEKEKFDLMELVKDLNEDSYNLINLGSEKVIKLLN